MCSRNLWTFWILPVMAAGACFSCLRFWCARSCQRLRSSTSEKTSCVTLLIPDPSRWSSTSFMGETWQMVYFWCLIWILAGNADAMVTRPPSAKLTTPRLTPSIWITRSVCPCISNPLGIELASWNCVGSKTSCTTPSSTRSSSTRASSSTSKSSSRICFDLSSFPRHTTCSSACRSTYCASDVSSLSNGRTVWSTLPIVPSAFCTRSRANCFTQLMNGTSRR
mmetsp:Transcript_60522/g.142561  ORF Transcript_60522/g.142561 Transcript_60522/m.142561 type:complete len:223 (-) Transcript_60522:1537-2205(-)